MSNNIDLDDLLDSIRLKLIRLREAKDISAYQLGLDSGVDNSVIFRNESGETNPNLITILKVLAALKVTPKDFFEEFSQEILLGK